MHNTLASLQNKALGSRSRRLSDYCFEQMRTLYHALSVDFDPTWFAYLSCIEGNAHHNVQSLADEIGVSQPAVSNMIKRLQDEQLIDIERKDSDKRHRTLTITALGKARISHIQPILQSIETVITNLDHGGTSIIEAITRFEAALQKTPLWQLIVQHLLAHHTITLTPHNDALHYFYETHNRAWVERYFELEPIDIAMLSDPHTHVFPKGGRIYIAMLDGKYPLGGFSLIPDGNRLELSKMYVPENLQGFGIGNQLLHLATEEAQQLGAKALYLMSNTILGPAIHLYKKHGFVEIPLTPEKQALYKRVNIIMERPLQIHNEQAA